ncbi:HEPN family nuclease [Peribacillus simplex]|uniref:HEPN family nuclease n=1 Tax=Peribacillus simplex TaxID=1478 RepID=UPI000BA7463F|nr:HEPN family nuclease [Peribacillus simplex]PAK34291.1 hypothetical protein CHI08_25580 [Peribacillus simplex]
MTGYVGKDFSKEFTNRTLKVFEQLHSIETEWEVTTLINLALGLIVVPSEYIKKENSRNPNRIFAERYFEKFELKHLLGKSLNFQPNDYLNGNQPSDQIQGNELNDMNYFNFLRLIRNGLSHGLVEFKESPIEAIQICNRTPRGKENFRVTLSIDDFRYSMQQIAKLHLELVDAQIRVSKF